MPCESLGGDEAVLRGLCGKGGGLVLDVLLNVGGERVGGEAGGLCGLWEVGLVLEMLTVVGERVGGLVCVVCAGREKGWLGGGC